MHYYTSYCEYCGVGQIWMQVAVLHCAWLTRIHIEYLDVQDRQVISACTAAEGDVWSVLPLFCILSASGKSTNHSQPPLPVLWWASDQMFRYFGVNWIEMRGGNDGFLVGCSWCHSVNLLLALMWSALANSYWPAPRCTLTWKKLFYHTNRWLSAWPAHP